MLAVVKTDADPVSDDFRPVHSPPAIELRGELQFGALGAHVDVHLVSGLSQYLREAPAVSERIEVVGDFWPLVEMFGKETSALSYVPDQGFGGREVDIGLKVPASTDKPAAFSDQLLDLFKKSGVIFKNPAVEKRLVMVENEAFVLLDQLYSVAKGGQRFRTSLFPAPLPDRVMGVLKLSEPAFLNFIITILSILIPSF